MKEKKKKNQKHSRENSTSRNKYQFKSINKFRVQSSDRGLHLPKIAKFPPTPALIYSHMIPLDSKTLLVIHCPRPLPTLLMHLSHLSLVNNT